MKPFVAFLLVLLFPFWVLAEPCSPVEVTLQESVEYQHWWMVLLDFLVQLSAPLIAGILGVLGTWLVRRIGKKLEADQVASLMMLKDSLVTGGVAFAEERARKELKVNGKQTQGTEKLSMALGYVQRQLEKSGVEKIAHDELTDLIEARLQMERAKPDGIVPSEPVMFIDDVK